MSPQLQDWLTKNKPWLVWVGGTLAALIVVMVIISADPCEGCTQDTTSATSPPPPVDPGPPIGTVQFGSDNCEYKYVGNQQYSPGEHCIVMDGYSDGVYGVFPYGDTEHRLYVVDTNDKAYNSIFPDSLGYWIRAPVDNPDAVEVQEDHANNVWVPYDQFVNDQKAAAQQAQTQADQEAAQEKIRLGEEQRAAFSARVDAINAIQARPPCDSSYNGCR